MAIKKSVYLKDSTIRLCYELTDSYESDDTNWSGSLNTMADHYQIFAEDCLPELTDEQMHVFYCIYNGYAPPPDIKQEINMLEWSVSEGYRYNDEVKELLGSEENALELIEKLKTWSRSQKLAVIYKTKSFWRQRRLVENENVEDC